VGRALIAADELVRGLAGLWTTVDAVLSAPHDAG
jgi:hypothetical protein